MQEWRDAQLKVECPRCGQGPGKPCRMPSGHLLNYGAEYSVHRARIKELRINAVGRPDLDRKVAAMTAVLEALAEDTIENETGGCLFCGSCTFGKKAPKNPSKHGQGCLWAMACFALKMKST